MISQEIVVTVGGGVFVESKLVIAKGLKYALIGRNGVGKSSLLKFIVQTFPKTMAVLCEQEPIALDLSAIETVMSFDERRLYYWRNLNTRILRMKDWLKFTKKWPI
jgi:ATPase subunit of ABC transporter with duplicated ATPase domains